jgi:sigma-B regulation protein RsbU (phosphoserine phosphatase)
MATSENPERILIVDDTPANLRLLSQLLKERGYQVRAVSSGARAFTSIKVEPPDLILLDIRMPEMDGYEVCTRIKAQPRTSDIPVLFISALDEIQDKMKAFSVGGLDYITKPFQLEEVVARVETHLALRRLQRNLIEANQRMERELMLAAQVQTSMMRTHFPRLPGWQFAGKLIPAKLTCGDFFDAFRLPDGKIAILIADVVDKGVGAALYMSMSCALLRSYILENPANPEQVFNIVNRRIQEDSDTDQFVTVFLGILDPKTGSMIYSNAGHNPPLLIQNSAGKSATLLARTGPALGILEDITWDQRQTRLEPGDEMVLYTDGITDAENARQEFYGLDRLIKIVQNTHGLSAQALLDALIGDLHQFTGNAAQFDDIALMILQRERES